MGNKLTCNYVSQEFYESHQYLNDMLKAANALSINVTQEKNTEENAANSKDNIEEIAKINTRLHNETKNSVGSSPNKSSCAEKLPELSQFCGMRKLNENPTNQSIQIPNNSPIKDIFISDSSPQKRYSPKKTTNLRSKNPNSTNNFSSKTRNSKNLITSGTAETTEQLLEEFNKYKAKWLKSHKGKNKRIIKLNEDSNMQSLNSLGSENLSLISAADITPTVKACETPIKRAGGEKMCPFSSESKSFVKYTKFEISPDLNKTSSPLPPYKPWFGKSKLDYIKPIQTIDLSKIVLQHNYFKGELYKYHPGFGSQYIKKYCRATNSYFEYCEPQCRYDMNGIFARIEYKDIISIKRVSVIHELENLRNKYQFEIFTKPGYSLEYTSMLKKWKEAATKPQQKIIYSKQQTLNRSQSENHSTFLSTKLSHKRLSLTTPTNKKPNGLLFDISDENLDNKNEKSTFVDRIEFTSKKEAFDYAQFVRDHGIQLSQIQFKEKLKTKSPKRWIQGMKGKQTWNNRELEWFFAEERLLFSAKTLEECERWIWIINYFLSKHNK